MEKKIEAILEEANGEEGKKNNPSTPWAKDPYWAPEARYELTKYGGKKMKAEIYHPTPENREAKIIKHIEYIEYDVPSNGWCWAYVRWPSIFYQFNYRKGFAENFIKKVDELNERAKIILEETIKWKKISKR